MGQIISTFGIDWRELLLQAFNFALLMLLLWYFLYRPILRIIDERRRVVSDGVAKAEAADKHLEDAKKEGEEMIGAAAREAESLVASARTHAQERGSEIVKEAEERAAATVRDAHERAEEAKRQAVKASEREIARAAVLAAEKILREKSA